MQVIIKMMLFSRFYGCRECLYFPHAYIDIELFLSLGSSIIPSVGVSRKAGNAWNIPHSTDMHYASTDASLFSSSLPILSHKKCMFELLFKVFGLVSLEI